jgi:hypothetical protein
MRARWPPRRRSDPYEQEADHRRTQFLAMLAHELRNPSPRPQRDTYHASDRQRPTAVNPSLDMLERQVGHMVRLVDDPLDVSRISRGMIELRREDIDLASTVHHAVEAARPLSESKQHEPTVSLPQQPMYLHGDRGRLAELFGNLLNNACKYTRRAVAAAECGAGRPARGRPSARHGHRQRPAWPYLRHVHAGRCLVGVFAERVGHWPDAGETTGGDGGTVDAHSDGVGQGSEFVVRRPACPSSKPRLEIWA